MFKIEPDGFYSRQDLAELLTPVGVDVDTFLGRLKPRKIFRLVWRGQDLLAAWDATASLVERKERAALPPARIRTMRPERQGAGAPAPNAPGAGLRAEFLTPKKERES